MLGAAVGDLIYVPVVIVFFALMVGFVVLCDRVLGEDVDAETDQA